MAEEARRLAEALGTSPTPPAKEVDEVLENFGRTIAALGVRLEPPKPN
jgi:hypothetical protein